MMERDTRDAMLELGHLIRDHIAAVRHDIDSRLAELESSLVALDARLTMIELDDEDGGS